MTSKMEAQKTFRGVGVDAGIILVTDYDFYKKYRGRLDSDNEFIKKFKLPIGRYLINWSIPNSNRGYVSGKHEVLEVTSGVVVVSDPCYIVGEALSGAKKYEQWDKVLKDTNFFKKAPLGVVVLDKMGGDGTYTVKLSIYPK